MNCFAEKELYLNLQYIKKEMVLFLTQPLLKS